MTDLRVKEFVKAIPLFGPWATKFYWRLRAPKRAPEPFPGSDQYWRQRYMAGGDSGVGSYGKFAEFKANVLNRFVATHDIRSVIEFGCGDGNQLGLADYPQYIGFDISEEVLARCASRFSSDGTKSFRLMQEYEQEKADLTLSLDVIYHLTEDDTFHAYMRTLFAASSRYVVIYSSNTNNNRGYEGTHVRHRKFTEWVDSNAPEWKLIEKIPNAHPYKGDYLVGSFADFYVFQRR